MRSRTENTTSSDGTTIAFERSGDGPTVVLVGASLQDRAMYRPVAQELARDFTVFNYDRRGRGESGDADEYAVNREIEDLGAVIAAAGGSASVYGHSSGAALALLADASGLPMTKLVLHEPPYTPDDDEERKRSSREDARRIKAFLAEDRRADAISYILNGIGLPPEMVEESSRDERMLGMAHTLAYDSEITADEESGGVMPSEIAGKVEVPTLILLGGESEEWMISVGKQTAETLPNGRYETLAGQGHFAPPEILAPVLEKFFAG